MLEWLFCIVVNLAENFLRKKLRKSSKQNFRLKVTKFFFDDQVRKSFRNSKKLPQMIAKIFCEIFFETIIRNMICSKKNFHEIILTKKVSKNFLRKNFRENFFIFFSWKSFRNDFFEQFSKLLNENWFGENIFSWNCFDEKSLEKFLAKEFSRKFFYFVFVKKLSKTFDKKF